jgi:HD-like signal output (HDOD) protein
MTRILFVDDESRVLDGLRRMLHGHRGRWQMTFAVGGVAALEALDAAPFDVLVTDMRMPQLDGLALLTRARERWPAMARIILSGQMDMDVAVRVAGVAHQLLAKPCDPTVLEDAVVRTQRLAALLTDETLRAAIGDVGALATHPAVYAELERVMADPSSGIADVSAIVQREVGLMAKVLQLVNSSFFGLPREVTAVEHAVAYLGVNVIRALALSHEVADRVGAHALAPGFSLATHQEHALRVAALARRVAGSGPAADDAFLAGVLHDVGELLLAMQRPDWLVDATAYAVEHEVPLHAAETAVFGVSHAEVGAYLVGLWGLPFRIVAAIAHHHVPMPGTGAGIAAAAVHVAELLANEAATPARGEPRVDGAYALSLGLPDRVEAWRGALRGSGGAAA